MYLTGCGLVMKEDITQRTFDDEGRPVSCGLVMKEDITQHISILAGLDIVVVW